MDGRKLSVLVLAIFLAMVGGASAEEGVTVLETFDDQAALDSWNELEGMWVRGIWSSLGVTSIDNGMVKVHAPRANGGVWVDLWATYGIKRWETISFDVKRVSTTPQSVHSTMIGIPYLTSGKPEPDSNYRVFVYREGLEGEWMTVNLEYVEETGNVLVEVKNRDTGEILKTDTIYDMDPKIIGFWATLTDTYFDNLEITEIGDANKGHGNDPDGVDEDNLGKGCENKSENGNRKRC